MTDRNDVALLTEALRRGAVRRDLMRWLTAAGLGAPTDCRRAGGMAA